MDYNRLSKLVMDSDLYYRFVCFVFNVLIRIAKDESLVTRLEFRGSDRRNRRSPTDLRQHKGTSSASHLTIRAGGYHDIQDLHVLATVATGPHTGLRYATPRTEQMDTVLRKFYFS